MTRYFKHVDGDHVAVFHKHRWSMISKNFTRFDRGDLSEDHRDILVSYYSELNIRGFLEFKKVGI